MLVKALGAIPDTVRHSLTDLLNEGLVAREWRHGEYRTPCYFYTITDSGRIEAGKFKDEEIKITTYFGRASSSHALPGDKDVDAAIERAKPRWRKGELFTEAEKQAYQTTMKGREYFGIQRYW